jgi:hypothetical protein
MYRAADTDHGCKETRSREWVGKGGNRRSKKKKSQVLTTGQGKKPTRANQEEKEKERDGGDPVRAARRRKEAAGGHQEQALRHKIRLAKQQRTKKVEGKRVRAHKSTLPAGSNQNEMFRVAAFNMDQGVSGAQAEMVLNTGVEALPTQTHTHTHVGRRQR